MEKTKEQTTISIPKEMRQEIEEIISSRLGYVTVAEYVRQAIRDKLQRDRYELQRIKAREKMEADYGEG